MLNVALLLQLGLAFFVPVIWMSRGGKKLSWRFRYLLSIFPLGYTFIGWQIGTWGFELFSCRGNPKQFAGCVWNGLDVTGLVEHGLFLGIPCIFFAMPLSLYLLFATFREHQRTWV